MCEMVLMSCLVFFLYCYNIDVLIDVVQRAIVSPSLHDKVHGEAAAGGSLNFSSASLIYTETIWP
jgi:hypothetical protein